MRRLSLAITIVLALCGQSAAQGSQTRATPPPVSGRQLSAPERITAADVSARLRLVQDNLELIGRYMGRDGSHRSLFRVENATAAEAYFASLNLLRRSSRFAFEQLRVDQRFEPKLPNQPSAYDAFLVADELLMTTLQIKASLKLQETIAEQVQPDTTTMSDVINQIFDIGAIFSNLVERRTSPNEVVYIVTATVHQAMALHRKSTNRLMPDEPEFVPNKSPGDVLLELQNSYDMLHKLGETHSVVMCNIKSDSSRRVTNEDVFEFSLLLAAQLDRLLFASGVERPRHYIGNFAKRFPSHAFRRARLLSAILKELSAASKPK